MAVLLPLPPHPPNTHAGTLPDVFDLLPKLSTLISRQSGFTGTLPPSLWGHTRLRALVLRSNDFSGSLQSNLAPDLEELDLASNSFSG